MRKFLLLTTLLSGSVVYAADSVERMSIIGTRDDLKKQTGSAHRLEEEDLALFSHTDIHRILKDIPGVNIQEEDGLGLRPNIGLRGAHPHRSRKITLLEDGVLIGPAPYSAPAAYYFPVPVRASAVEVFKGPSAVRFGPNSIGGAVNIVTRSFSDDNEAAISSELGSFGFKKFHGYISDTWGSWSYLIEGTYLEGDGFKTLNNSDDTGFKKDDLMVKGRYRFNHKNSLTLKLVRAHEQSFETYLGLTQADFDQDPYQRYEASEKDEMNWNRDQLMLSYDHSGDSFDANVKLYRHWFFRNWSKFSGFSDSSISPRDVLNNPIGGNRTYYDVLVGEEDSLSFNDKIVVGDNKRTYRVEGVQGDLSWDIQGLGKGAVVHLGARLHEDLIQRDHTEETYLMSSGSLVQDPDSTIEETNQIYDESQGQTLYGQWDQYWDAIKWTLGARYERVATTRINRLSPETGDAKNKDQISVLGTGLFYDWSENLGFFGGVNQGVTLVGPGQDDSIEPEKALNYELGLRFTRNTAQIDAVLFLSDYSNIKGTCTFSAGCSGANLDSEYNGGQAVIQGLELKLANRWNLGLGDLFGNLTYTYTDAYFTESGESTNPEWGVGTIQPGDPLPYIAKHMASTTIGFQFSSWELALSYQYKGKVYDQAVAVNRVEIDSYGVLDFSLKYRLQENHELYSKVDNLLNDSYVVSARPYGLRPGKPQMFFLGYRWMAF